jgi:pyrimidine-nucleoside phosphorylase
VISYRLIERKRNGGTLAPAELRSFLGGYLNGDVPEYQMAAFLMSVFFQGLDPEELTTLVEVMLGSGATLDLGHLDGPRIDKHSTGGVGDKVSLVLAPLVAELGVFVPMMSGRGLGHTGGTLDKLEAIPGFRTDLSLDRFRAVLVDAGCAMIGQTSEIAPLDRRLYALRSVTATVPSIPLIAASIMSKKLAEGLTGLVLDVKAGAGAFIPEADRGRLLARTMAGIGAARGVPTTALVTAMDRPLGQAVGNGLETAEAFRCLAGEGPDDLAEVTVALAGEMLLLGGLAPDSATGRAAAQATLSSGRAVERMARMVSLQGGDGEAVPAPARLPRAPVRATATAPRDGVVHHVHPVPLGYGVIELGGGRRKLDDSIDPRVGFVLRVRPGDPVAAGGPLGDVHAASEEDARRGADILEAAVEIGDGTAPTSLPLIGERIRAG